MEEDEVPPAYRRIDDLGLTVPVGLRLPAHDGMGEIVKTYADCAITAVFYRSDWRAMPHVLEPFEIAGGSGGMVGDLRVFRHGPVEPDRHQIKVSFEGFASWDEGEFIPVDRTRTAAFDRYLSGTVPRRELEGIRAEVVDLRAGLLRTSIELSIRATDPDILALQLDRSGFGQHVQRGPGDPRLWRDWHRPTFPAQMTEVREIDGRTTAKARSSVSVGFRRLTPEEIAAQPPREDPPPEWTAKAQPGAIPLAVQGGSGRGGPQPGETEIGPILYCDAAPEAARSIDLSLDRLWAYRYDHASTRLPAPQPEGPVDLTGLTLGGATCNVRLDRWDSTEQGFTLFATCEPPEAWPDVRVLSDASSASFWTSAPQQGGEIRLGLPLSYAELFAEPTVELALRMVARRVTPFRFRLPLTPPRAGPAR